MDTHKAFPPEQMYTDAGNLALREALLDLAIQIDMGQLRRSDLPVVMKGLCKRITSLGHPEVHDTEPEWHIVDTVNEMCDREGWTHVSRDDL